MSTRGTAVISLCIALLLVCSFMRDNSESARTNRLIMDTICARLIVDEFDHCPRTTDCVAFDLIFSCRFGEYVGTINNIGVHILEGGESRLIHYDFPMQPGRMRHRDSVRFHFSGKYNGFDTVHVHVKLTGPYYEVAGEGQRMKFNYIGNVFYIDTLLVPIQKGQQGN